MAIFQDTRELDRQAEIVGMDKTKGWRARGLSMLGYNDDGTRRKGGFETIAGRLIAGQLATGDTKEVLRETRDEFWAKKLSQGKVAFEGAKLGLSLMTGGGSAGLGKLGKLAGGSGKIADAVGGKAGDVVAGLGGSSSLEKGTNLLAKTMTENGIQTAKDSIDNKVNEMIEGKSDKDLLDSFTNEKDDEQLEDLEFTQKDENGDEYFIDSNGEKVYTKDTLRKERFDKNVKKFEKVLGYVPMVGALGQAGMQAYGAAKEQNNEAQRLVDSFEKKEMAEQEFNLL